ncbi:MAG: hypothetical protein JEZ00_04080 [Anaerolineaceae bacterium]|nr:hypothetical protein [Anaerolineaceae bacterium]
MAFALSIVKLAEAMEKPGCMICRMEHEAAIHALTSLLWESTTDYQSRQMINNALGFCPQHLRTFVAIELSKSGPTLGTNLIYESLSKNIATDLHNIQRKEQVNRKLRGLLAKLNIHLRYSETPNVLKSKEPCPACETVNITGENTFSTLCEVITKNDEKMVATYEKSDGICLNHLRIGLTKYMVEFPEASEFLIQDTVQRLSDNRENMLEFVRKHNWKYKHEELIEEEKVAWIKTMTFFSGYPGERFDHHIDKF